MTVTKGMTALWAADDLVCPFFLNNNSLINKQKDDLINFSTPEGWTPAEWEVFITSDEPYFETEALREGFTFAFRGRAKNSAGYGEY